MFECIAMAIGFVLGAACVIVSLKASQKKRPTESLLFVEEEEQAEKRDFQAERGSELKASLRRQWENFLNYDGTEKGQVSIGDDE